MTNSNVNFDIIGDIHGYAKTLAELLDVLGYTCGQDGYQHTSRKVIFLGDFIDRGPQQREVITIVRDMIEAGNALSVMGNHEFNAIAYYTWDDEKGDYLRPHNAKNQKQHRAFLDVYENTPDDYDAVIAWFLTLPLWQDLDDLKVIHACWDRQRMDAILEFQQGSHLLGEELLRLGSIKGAWQYEAIETLLKGKEIPLAEGLSFLDKDDNERHDIRVRWWDRTATTYRQAYLGPESARTSIPEDEINGDHLIEYAHDAPPVFLGHYWMVGEPEPLAPNIACVDYSVAKPGGKLVAYRWDGNGHISKGNFVSVDRKE